MAREGSAKENEEAGERLSNRRRRELEGIGVLKNTKEWGGSDGKKN
jgi:hypothetical protein